MVTCPGAQHAARRSAHLEEWTFRDGLFSPGSQLFVFTFLSAPTVTPQRLFRTLVYPIAILNRTRSFSSVVGPSFETLHCLFLRHGAACCGIGSGFYSYTVRETIVQKGG